MGIVKAFRYPVTSEWLGGRLLRLGAGDKHELLVATPPEFPGGMRDVWSPEDLLVASVGACFDLTLVAIAEQRGIPVISLRVRANGHLEHGGDGRYGFTVIELDAELETEAGFEEQAQRAAQVAKERCIVGRALDTPVHLRLDVHAAQVKALAT
ncbi:MAG TPA: OsmC family protein [Gaiella sp.]|jgi:organic hydroperoxide reductase OsmC/OhrA